jgi:hypothetical protein
VALKEEACIFVNVKYKVFIMFYVNDIQVLYYKNDKLHAVKIVKSMKEAYELRDMGDVTWFLGIQVIRDRAA